MAADLARVYRTVRRIPRGKVATYGQIARLAGLHRHARRVGYAMSVLPEGLGVPWHRVVNARGGLSPRGDPGSISEQRRLLEREGVDFGAGGRIELERFGWRPAGPR